LSFSIGYCIVCPFSLGKKDKQYNDQKKKDKQYNDQKKQDKQYNNQNKKDKQYNIYAF
jgi:hypothetical protein